MLKSILQVLYKNSHIIRNNKISHKKLFINYINQKGSGNPKELQIEYKDNIIKFEKSEIDEDNYVLYSTDELDCVSILINKTDKIAEIHGIGNYETCVNTTLSNKSVGSILLKVTIKILKKYKNKFNINKIILVDNSMKKCNKYNIEFSTMMILLNGHTWYGSYGFRPIDSSTYELDKIKNDKYNKNINIISTITIEQANILKYISLTKKKLLINDVKELLSTNPNYLLSDYLKSLLHNYDNTCKYFNMFYKELFNDIGLTNFRGQPFGLELYISI